MARTCPLHWSGRVFSGGWGVGWGWLGRVAHDQVYMETHTINHNFWIWIKLGTKFLRVGQQMKQN
jgi:hypothetical protein